MIRVKGYYRNQVLELAQPIDLPENTEVEIAIEPLGESMRQEWAEIGMDRLETEWDNPGDAIYDNWKTLYGVECR